jgi:hypothetical protein
MKKVLIGLTLSLVLTSCFGEPTEIVKTNNNDFNIELLFEVDGCNGSVNWKTGDKHSDKKEIQTVIK